jgi:DNA processing protein
VQRDELAGWLRLALTPGIGNEAARKLLAAFGLPAALWGQSDAALAQVLTPTQRKAFRVAVAGFDAQLETTWNWLNAAESGPRRSILCVGDAAYPQALLEAPDPPLMLYALGNGTLEPALGLPGGSPGVAIVGSRNPTPQGAANAESFARSLSQAGLMVVSGMALGVDAAAHQGALDGAGTTIAIVGTGLDRVYPKRNLELAHRISECGLILSEFALGTPPLNPNFPRRNRIIAALGQGTLVVEAALQSGSLITARLAVEQGRDVFAIPGSIHSTQSRGCHALIRQGAKLVETAQDVLEEFRIPSAANLIATPPDLTLTTDPNDSENQLLQALGFDPCSLDALQARVGLPTPQLQAALLELELNGLVARLPGGLFQQLRLG